MISDLTALVKALHENPKPESSEHPGNAVRAYTKTENEFEVKPKFYADAETLKQGSGYYDNIESVSLKGEWIENCQDCHVAMSLLQATGDITGIPDSVHVSHRNKSYTKWLQDGCKYDNGKIWLCPVCSSAWSVIQGQFWAKLIINNQYTFRTENIKSYPKKPAEDKSIMSATEKKPSADATICSDCNVYREITEHSETHNRHVCPKCHSGSLVPKQPESSEAKA